MSSTPGSSSKSRNSNNSNCNNEDNSNSNNYIFYIKWLILGLIISLGSVFVLDLVISVFHSNSNDNNSPKNANHKKSNNPDNNNNQRKHTESELKILNYYANEKFPNSEGMELCPELKLWLKENEFENLSSYFQNSGVVTLISVVQLAEITEHESSVSFTPLPFSNINNRNPSSSLNTDKEKQEVNNNRSPDERRNFRSLYKHLPIQDRERLQRATVILRQRLILRLWLDDNGLQEYATKFNSLGVNSIEDAYWYEDFKTLEFTIGAKIVPMWKIAKKSLPSGSEGLERLKTNLWNRLVNLDNQSIWNTWGTMLLVTLSVSGFGAVATYFPQMLDAKKAIFQYVSGKFSLANNCEVEFDWDDPVPVGQTVSMRLRFFQRGGRPYPICDKDNLLIEIRKDSQKVSVVTEFGGKDNLDVNLVVVKFSVRKAGQYSINVLAENNHVKGSPFIKTFLPGPIDPIKTLFIKQTSTVVCVTGSPHKLIIEPRDSFGNRCRTQDYDINAFRFVTRAVGTDETQVENNCSMQFAQDFSSPTSALIVASTGSIHNNTGSTDSGRVALTTRFHESGVFHGNLTYNNQSVQNGYFDIISLTKPEATAVQKNVAVKSASTYYEGRLLALGREIQTKSRKVYVTISAKQLVVKEYFLKLVPIRVATFRLSPNTKILFLGTNNQTQLPTILIDDGSQPSVKLTLKDAKVVVATFTHFLLRNIGGSETFQDKQDYFFKELRDLHRKHPREKTWKATKGLSSHDWCRNFDVCFTGEQGIDWGGLRREWFEKVTTRLFESGNPVGMFHSFPESHLVHPNPNTKWKSKHYEMAGRIVGKCLYESALGSAYRQMVKASFTRSFLAQLIGLRVTYKYFEHDDPELYVRKVKFILENDVEPMEMTFTEEEYELGKLVKTVDLIPEGSKILVTNENKKEYLNALAQYRLCSKIKSEIEAFLKGLNEIVPDELLTIFDENELELLMCGTSEYSVTDLREHHMVCGSSEDYRKVLDWFWTIVGNMTEEEKGRLLQFTTGSSLLPAGGFKELSPLFQIIFSPSFGTLPTAHTCFNQLCLPDYDSYESFEKSLRIAINEGSEGFGLI